MKQLSRKCVNRFETKGRSLGFPYLPNFDHIVGHGAEPVPLIWNGNIPMLDPVNSPKPGSSGLYCLLTPCATKRSPCCRYRQPNARFLFNNFTSTGTWRKQAMITGRKNYNSYNSSHWAADEPGSKEYHEFSTCTEV